MRRAPACARDLVPARQQLASGPPGQWIDVEHLEIAHIDGALRGRQHEVGQLGVREVIGGTVVDRHRQALWQDIRIVDAHATPQTVWATRV